MKLASRLFSFQKHHCFLEAEIILFLNLVNDRSRQICALDVSYIQLASTNRHKFYFRNYLGSTKLARKICLFYIFKSLWVFFEAWVTHSVMSFILNALILPYPQLRFYILSTVGDLTATTKTVNDYLFASVSRSSLRQGQCLFFLYYPQHLS